MDTHTHTTQPPHPPLLPTKLRIHIPTRPPAHTHEHEPCSCSEQHAQARCGIFFVLFSLRRRLRHIRGHTPTHIHTGTHPHKPLHPPTSTYPHTHIPPHPHPQPFLLLLLFLLLLGPGAAIRTIWTHTHTHTSLHQPVYTPTYTPIHTDTPPSPLHCGKKRRRRGRNR
jgi:hypothetical protein